MGKALGQVKNPPLKHNNIYLESPFGKRTYKGKVEQHNGIDLQYRYPTTKLKDNKEDTIIAIESGVVVKVTYSKSRGYYVEIKHNKIYTSRYLHMKKNSIKVSVGQKIIKGQELGITGMTGAADGIHLHLAIIENGYFVDPLPFVLGEKDINPTIELNVPYKTLKKKYKRYEACVGNNKVPYKVLSVDDKKKCDNVLGYARTKIGVIYTFYDIKFDIEGNLWATTTKPTSKQPNKHWICVWDSTGYQVKKI